MLMLGRMISKGIAPLGQVFLSLLYFKHGCLRIDPRITNGYWASVIDVRRRPANWKDSLFFRFKHSIETFLMDSTRNPRVIMYP
jgi:hypothetical protein